MSTISTKDVIVFPPDRRKLIHLSALDYAGYRGYIPGLLCFPFDASKTTEAITALQHALQRTVLDFPYMAGSLQNDRIPGCLIIRYAGSPPDVTTSHLTVKYLDKGEGAFPHTYAELYAAGMPPSKLPGELLMPLPKAPALDEPAPCVASQATFIPGGLILCFMVHHSVVDGFGAAMFMKTFAKHLNDANRLGEGKLTSTVRKLVDTRLGPAATAARRRNPNLSFPSILQDIITVARGLPQLLRPSSDPGTSQDEDTKRQALSRGRDSNGPPPFPCTDFKLAPDPGVVAALPSNPPPKATGRIFTIPVSKLRLLKSSVTSYASTDLGPGEYVSTLQCLAALVWCHVTRARAPHLDKAGSTTMGLPVNVRERVTPGLGAGYLGNAVYYARATMGVGELLGLEMGEKVGEGESGLASITTPLLAAATLTIRSAIARITDSHIRNGISHILSLPTTALANLGWNIDWNYGTDMYFTSWASFGGSDSFAIPGTGVDREQWLRKPFSANDGAVIVLPRRGGEESDFEVQIELECGDMERLCGVGGLGEWAVKIVE